MPETMKIEGGCLHESCGQPLGKVVEQETKRGRRASLVCMECGTFVRWLSSEYLAPLPVVEPEPVEDDEGDEEEADKPNLKKVENEDEDEE